jgi:hypothetical protein
MSKRNDELVEFIATLSASEKRHFNLKGTKDAGTHHMKLYKLLQNKGRAGKEEKAEAGINISYERLYLQKMMLRSLRSYHEEDTVEMKLYTGMANLEILFGKGLYGMCLKMVKKQIELAVENELFAIELQLYQYYRWILLRLNKFKHLTRSGGELYKKEMDCLEKSRELVMMKDLKSKFVQAMLGYNAGRDDVAAKLRWVVKHPLLKARPQGRPFKNVVIYYEILCWYYRVNFEFAKAFLLYTEIITLFENKRGKIGQLPQIYLAFLSNYTLVCLYAGKYNEAGKAIGKIENLGKEVTKEAGHNIAGQVKQNSLEKRIMLCFYSGDFKAGAALFKMEATPAILTQMQPAIALSVRYFGALCCMYNGDVEEALKLMRYIIDYYSPDNDIEILLLTDLAHVMVHIELGNVALLPHLIVSVKRFCKKWDIKRQSVIMMLKWFEKIAYAGIHKRGLKEMGDGFKHALSGLNLQADKVVIRNLGIHYWRFLS